MYRTVIRVAACGALLGTTVAMASPRPARALSDFFIGPGGGACAAHGGFSTTTATPGHDWWSYRTSSPCGEDLYTLSNGGGAPSSRAIYDLYTPNADAYAINAFIPAGYANARRVHYQIQAAGAPVDGYINQAVMHGWLSPFPGQTFVGRLWRRGVYHIRVIITDDDPQDCYHCRYIAADTISFRG